ncbi:MAG: urease accessory protein UreD [Sphingobacteriales bacterium]|nr:urease accessory protein UreD [Sphingobacteriales bacterium]MBI3720509.1 urease accessory protein UreD [Sphingobacteriales bacterium]
MKAQLHIQAALRNGKTYLKQGYFSPPFKIANITENKKAHALELMLMSSSPGILNGDEYEIKVEVDDGCSLQLFTQSYQRLFNMKKGATQTTAVALGENASFIYIPHPAVPHYESVFISKNNIHLNKSSQLIWGEILTCGRKLNGEVFQLSKYHNLTEIYINQKLIIKENLLIQPSFINPSLTGQLENYTHQASLIIVDESINTAIIKEEVAVLLAETNEIDFGVTNAPVNGIIIRILGNKAEQLFQLLQSISLLIQKQNKVVTSIA